MLKITLIGAPQTGKTQLAGALRDVLKSSARVDVIIAVAGPDAIPFNASSNDLTLLMGLDLAFRSFMSNELQTYEAIDQSIRTALSVSGIDYRVIYGGSEARLAQALQAIDSVSVQPFARPNEASTSRPASGKNGLWVWACDKCSDPDCEQHLLSDLLAQRPRAVGK